jgi:hypothetical protein
MAQVVALKSKKQWFRQMAHEQLDKWLDAYEQQFEQTSTPTLSQLSQFFTDSRCQLFGALLQGAIDEHFAPLLDQPQAQCPKCGKACRQHRKSTKTLVTLNGPVQLERPWYYCKACQIGFSPLDQLLEVARQHHQFDVQQKVLKLAARMPFAEASVAKAQYGENSPQAFQWVEATICRLYFGEAANVIAGLGRMKAKDQTAAEQIRKLIDYLRNNAERIDYGHFRNKGFPIGSGGIESANKFICHSRMKRSGAWWVKQTGNAMLRLRCALYNGTFDKVFESYKKKCLGPKSSVFV